MGRDPLDSLFGIGLPESVAAPPGLGIVIYASYGYRHSRLRRAGAG